MKTTKHGKFAKQKKTPCIQEFQIAKTNLKSQNLKLYPNFKISKTIFTL
jgi:hypothetical protein